MNFNQSMPFPYQNLPNTPVAMPTPLDYKPFTFEKLSNIIGQTYNLSSIENMNTVPLPRGSEQQIFFVNNDEKIYTRQFDNSIGIVGYKQDYVQKLMDELNQAQTQLHEIFESVTNSAEEVETPNLENRVSKLEDSIQKLINLKEESSNEYPRDDKAMAAISELA